MEITFAVLLWGVRIAFLLLLYLFLLRAFGVLHRALVAERAADGATRALGVLVVERSAGHSPRVGERFSLRASTSMDSGLTMPIIESRSRMSSASSNTASSAVAIRGPSPAESDNASTVGVRPSPAHAASAEPSL